MTNLTQTVKDAGFAYTDNLIHLFVGGSELHGAKLQGTDDTDIYGVYIEPPEKILGLDHSEHFVWSTALASRRNVAGDVDITLYSLRKFAGLACKGNPTALQFLFAPNRAEDSDFWCGIKEDIKKCVLSKAAASQFVGFVDAQMGRLLGTRGRGKKGQRPELEEKFGYDVKAGMHAMRLLFECIELLQFGKITLPRPEYKMLIDIRSGHWSLDHLCQEVSKLRDAVSRAEVYSILGDNPDRERLSGIISNAYLRYWNEEIVKLQKSAEKKRRNNVARAAWELMQHQKRQREDRCPHLAGSLGATTSASWGSPTCIIQHTFEDDPQHAVLICLHCGKQWRHTDRDYIEWKNRRSTCTPSTGGLRTLESESRNTAIDYLRSKVELVDEPLLTISLHEFLVANLLKLHPDEAAKILCRDPQVLKKLRDGGLA